jgi:hypothetical protein
MEPGLLILIGMNNLVVSVKYLPQIAQIRTDKFVKICEICGKELTTTHKFTCFDSTALPKKLNAALSKFSGESVV